ncbi:type II CAAX endopeptidase family protein [Bacteroides uniformis]|jgi:membrane protease YdiL (CAAX protease family)|uniref:CPBP family intramembrane glutamic endopeptidase n=1 Tax=Bacteroides TaxID=816 RepID=UPI000E737FEB|nr:MULTISPECIES: type II CAAX endopeptidase family protein [unclassified Bacteroides]RJV26229.1 CPBP family intramembrane metalloprotease [Bacteroides sp. AF25-17LB]RJV28408.1 CPBP family intramembrane metalloprotease [Bacteroides sp. AF25-5LB]
METEETVKEGLVTASKAKSIWLAFVDIVLFAVLSMIFLFLFAIPFALVFPELKTEVGETNIYFQMLNEVLMLVSGLIAACMVLGFRKLPFSGLGLSLKGWGRSLLRGALFVVFLYVVGFGLSLLLGAVEVVGFLFSPISLLVSLLLYFFVALTEEVIGRGFILGRMLDGGINKFVALFISAVLFSLMHLFNPNFAFVPFLNIMLAGCFLGASYIYTRNLCFPIALHWFWNWIQGSVLGYKVSGNEFSNENLLILHFPEENLINGGTFGFEGSILCSLLLVLGTVIILRHYYKGLEIKD